MEKNPPPVKSGDSGPHADNEKLSRGFLHHLLGPCFPDQSEPVSGITDIFHLKNRIVGLQDIAINHNVRSLTWTLGTNYKEIKFDAEGRMFYKLPCRKRIIPVNFIKLLGTVDKERGGFDSFVGSGDPQ